MVTTPVASQLTGLSTDKLREWTSRRALVPADVRPKGKGSPAKFSWQTILVLRIAALLHDQFRLELQAHRASLAVLQRELRTKSFIALWGCRLAFCSDGGWIFLDEGAPDPKVDLLLIHLNMHLSALRDGFALPDAAASGGQLDLFSLPTVRRGGGRQNARASRPTGASLRRSA